MESKLLSGAEHPGTSAAVATDALAVAVMARRLFPRGQHQGLEPNGAQVLLALHAEPDQPASRLADELLLARPTVSNTLKELQRRGLVDEFAHQTDRRWRRQRLTADGQHFVEVLLAHITDELYAPAS